MNIYLANKMTDRPHFNAAWFQATKERLKETHPEWLVSTPIEMDEVMGLDFSLCPLGIPAELSAQGFSEADAHRRNLRFLLDIADAVLLGPEWTISDGSIFERMTARKLGIKVYHIDPEGLVKEGDGTNG